MSSILFHALALALGIAWPWFAGVRLLTGEMMGRLTNAGWIIGPAIAIWSYFTWPEHRVGVAIADAVTEGTSQLAQLAAVIGGACAGAWAAKNL